MRIILFLALIFAQPCFSQTIYNGAVNSEKQQVFSQQVRRKNETKFKDSERAETLKQDIKEMRGSIGTSQDAINARNLLLLKEVLDFKIKDETLAPEIEKLKQNREFNTKLLKALNELDNKKLRNRKNQEVINILNDAGNRLYNSLTN